MQNILYLFGSLPKLDFFCSQEKDKLPSSFQNFFNNFENLYQSPQNGFLNIEELIEDTMIVFERKKDLSVVPFQVVIELNGEVITQMSGQLKDAGYRKKCIHGLGRKIVLKTCYNTNTDGSKGGLTGFKSSLSYVFEGQFLENQLNGFGRSIRSDGK